VGEHPDDALFDVGIAGGGVIGAAAALGLARQGWRVLLVEPSRPEIVRGSLGTDLRTLAVSPASRMLLEELGVWQAVPTAPYRGMEVWEERGTRAMCFDAGDAGRDELGWIVENSPLVAALWHALEQRDNVTIHAGRVAGLQAASEAVHLELAGVSADAPAAMVATRLLVAADGAASAVRDLLGVAVRRFDVGQEALATAVRTERPHEGVAYQRFLLDGPVALLPGIDARVSTVVWSQSVAAAGRRRLLDDADFAAELGRAVQHRLGTVEAVDRRLAFPLAQQLAESFNPQPRALLVGDAGRVVHPLAGLGANLGFEDVAAMLGVLAAAAPAADPGAAGLWQAFDRRRSTRARLMVSMLGALRRVYARGDPWSQWVRNLGVGVLDAALPLKRQIMVEAMGLGPVGRAAGGRD
jgi:2-octaprenyl-3-methyl-6-methoxy-1,4-benzoquinol hydroxylase/2-octaprenylphenol hydroxylase